MKSFEWSVSDKCFREVDDPTYDPNADDAGKAIRNAGYMREFSSQGDDWLGASVEVYRTLEPGPGKPAFYISLMGENTGIATFVAADFLSLLATLQQIQPFLTLIRIDQEAWKASKVS